MAYAEVLTRAYDNSPFLAGLIDRHPTLVALIEQGAFDAALDAALAVEHSSLGAQLRIQRQGVALVTAIADLSGAWDLAKVTQTLSDFADTALEQAITAAITERMPDAEPRGFAVIALGKHGGRELNYSSDIDPIFLFDPKTLPHRERDDVGEAAVRYGRRVIELLSARDEHGYVFRVDMRLRPSPEVSPIVLPVEGAIGYYESSALAWEQAAFIRSRFSAGDAMLGAYFLKSIQPFIWRKSLDFGQLKNISAMTAQIRNHYSKGQLMGPGFDLKRGLGGIRECEFYAQAHQLIHGGRDGSLRRADTREALAALAHAGHIDAAQAARLSESYVALRTIEHRLQMRADQQTHMIPNEPDLADAVARLHGMLDAREIFAFLEPITQGVAAIYGEIVEAAGDRGEQIADGGVPLTEQLGNIGFSDCDAMAARIARWRSGQLRAVRSEAGREAFEAVLPATLNALALAPDPEQAVARYDNLISTLPSAINFFRLLEARPALLQLLADILSYAPTLAEALARHSSYIDALVHASAMDMPGNAQVLADLMRQKCQACDYQETLDGVRDFVGEQRFALGVQLIEGRHDALAISRSYAHLAEAALQVLTQATVAEFEKAHGRVIGGELVILALGRLGGEALTHASDLDLVLLFSGDFAAESDGARPLGATLYFNRLAQRVIAALSVQTAAGALYEVDTRLRPSGGDGPLCCSVDSFIQYQRDKAWTWEHLALTRARCVYGGAAARARVEKAAADIFAIPRNIDLLRRDALSMRRDMAEHKPIKGPLDMKLARGGLVDAEFIIHVLQLQSGKGLHPQLDKAVTGLVAAGLLPVTFGEAQDLLTRLLILVRLVAPDCQIPTPATQTLIAQVMGETNWAVLQDKVDAAKDHISGEWQKLFDQKY